MIFLGERPFACDMCERRFREFSDLKKHRRRHSAEPNFICMVCRQQPPIESDPTRCLQCCTQSKNAVLMAAAIKNAEEETVLNRESAQQPSAEETSIKSVPLTTPHSQKSETMVADVLLSPITNNGSATTAISPPPPDESLTTSLQSSDNSRSPEDTQHILDNIPAVHRPGHNQLGMITRKEFPCPLCNRAFGTRHNLKRHYMIHTGEKPFNCTKCRKPFREYSTLKKHMVTHQRDRWYKCMRCPSKFRDFIKYTEHKESHSVDDDDNSQEAPEGSSPKSRGNYMDSNDEDSMMSDDWLECCECGQRFNEIDSYNRHLKEKHLVKHKNITDR